MEILSEISGKPVEDLRGQRQEGKPYGEIAEDYDKLEEFRQQMLDQKKAVLDKRVEEGYLTREQADEMEERMGAYCNGEGGKGFCGKSMAPVSEWDTVAAATDRAKALEWAANGLWQVGISIGHQKKLKPLQSDYTLLHRV